MFEILNDLFIRKDKEAIACILISLSVEFCSDCTFYAINLSLVILLFVDTHSTAPASDSFPYFHLAPDGTRLSIQSLDER